MFLRNLKSVNTRMCNISEDRLRFQLSGFVCGIEDKAGLLGIGVERDGMGLASRGKHITTEKLLNEKNEISEWGPRELRATERKASTRGRK